MGGRRINLSHIKRKGELMKRRGIRKDLQERFVEAETNERCLIAITPSDARRLRAAAACGNVVSPAQGIYARPTTWQVLKPPKRSLYAIRALQKLHPNWVFCGPSAAVVYGLAVSYSLLDNICVATTRKAHVNANGARGIVRYAVEGDSITEVDGIRVTSVSRTVFDCIRHAGFREGLAVADSVLYKKLAMQDELIEQFSRMPSKMDGRSKAIDVMRLANGLAENGGESVARAVMIERGFRLPQLQKKVPNPVDRSDCYRVDFYWDLGDGNEVIGELDGHEKYLNPRMTNGKDIVEVMTDERLRESRVCGSGAKVMRFSYANVLDRAWFTRLLCCYGIPRDADIPQVAMREDDPEATLAPAERLFLGKWLVESLNRGLPMPLVA